MSLKRGALVVLEGVDRSGKSTQCRKLVESLNSNQIKSELMVFPDRTTLIGKMINTYLSNKECDLHDKAIHLLFSANRWENAEKMKELLQSGVTLIVDRYSYSGIAYSSSKPGMDIEWCKTQELGLPKPDLVLLLTLGKEQMNKRPGFGDERYENDDMQSKVLNIFHQLADNTWEVVDASPSIDEVHKTLLDKIIKVREDVAETNLGTLKFKCCK
ncbi:PREDICTED: thymidylate kinase [Nicrophorus vespilloides]|uniref:dTMP kinase n=1 Tax=Nicrophorus vespilloides TaxID=110193 RepID=A0ABM1MJR1_NICVS|nr:PREDICTED: thymidylate kinase [Nicrophorus vespilloides]